MVGAVDTFPIYANRMKHCSTAFYNPKYVSPIAKVRLVTPALPIRSHTTCCDFLTDCSDIKFGWRTLSLEWTAFGCEGRSGDFLR